MSNIVVAEQDVTTVYKRARSHLEIVRERLGRHLTLAEKILFGHLEDPHRQELQRNESFLLLSPDRVAMQDATAQMALLQFMLSGKSEVAVPTTVHADHLIAGAFGADEDLHNALKENDEVYQFLASACACYGIPFWEANSGIIHQVVLETYAFPGGMMIGTDSHTPNAGGLGMLACGVGGADACDVMAGLPWELKHPGLIGVALHGELSPWSSPKDIIIALCGILSTKGGTNHILEFFGEGCASVSCTGKATITNMGAELGATCSLFPYDERMVAYLDHTDRQDVARLASQNRDLLVADPETALHPETYYDRIIEIDLAKLEPQITGPHSPDASTPLSEMKKRVREEDVGKLHSVLIGSCTNSSYEDISRAASILRQGIEAGLTMPQPFYLSPGSARIRATLERDGLLATFREAGAVVLANACGPCIGQWRRQDFTKGERNVILNSFNRNFPGRNDGNPETLSFIASPETTAALGFAGRLDFDPRSEPLTQPDGKPFVFSPPCGEEFPPMGFPERKLPSLHPPQDSQESINIKKDSRRLQRLSPFPAWDGQDREELLLLTKVKGKCTTDHISPAGSWLQFRGHLDNISSNLLLGGINAFTQKRGLGLNLLSARHDRPFAEIARHYLEKGRRWVIVGDENYGEGSSREHAAMSPRFLGCAAVIARSFARIHETNLKKQGVLALTFKDPRDYDRIHERDHLAIHTLSSFAPRKSLLLTLTHVDGKKEMIEVCHSYNQEQIFWFQAGSALNLLRKKP